MSGHEIDDPSGGGPSGNESWPEDRLGSTRLTDIDAYRLLVRLGHTLHRLSARCWSTAAATALAAAAKALRLLASALYRADISDESKIGHLHQPGDLSVFVHWASDLS